MGWWPLTTASMTLICSPRQGPGEDAEGNDFTRHGGGVLRCAEDSLQDDSEKGEGFCGTAPRARAREGLPRRVEAQRVSRSHRCPAVRPVRPRAARWTWVGYSTGYPLDRVAARDRLIPATGIGFSGLGPPLAPPRAR